MYDSMQLMAWSMADCLFYSTMRMLEGGAGELWEDFSAYRFVFFFSFLGSFTFCARIFGPYIRQCVCQDAQF